MSSQDEASQDSDLRQGDYRYRNMFNAIAVSFWELDFREVGTTLRRLRDEGVTDFRAYFESNPAAIRDLMALSRVTDVNAKTMDLFGASNREDMLGPVDRFWPEESEHVFLESVLASVARIPSYMSETRLRRTDGSLFDALFTVSFSPEIISQGIVLVGVIDITERNRAQERYQRSMSDLAHASRISTLGEMAASIAHEVNQPLSAIVTNGEASLRWLKRAEPNIEEVTSNLAAIIADGQRASAIIGRIRDMAAKRDPVRIHLDLNAAVREAISLTRPDITSARIQLSVDLSDQPAHVLFDPVQLQQVIINLLMNAVHALSEAAREDPGIHLLSSFDDDGYVSLRISDNGPGISTEARDKLFGTFYTTKATGMGMGLSICRSILEASDGSISLCDSPLGGAGFHVRLPACEEISTPDRKTHTKV